MNQRSMFKPALMTAVALNALLGSLSGFAADAYPTKPIRLVVPFTPGGSTDILARLVGQRLYETLGQQVIIDNRPGAGGTIGMEMTAKAAPDGYTMVMGHIGTLAVNPTLYTKLSYDPVKDFQPVTLLAKIPNMMAVNPSVPVKTVKELLALAKAKPGGLNYGSGGNGSAAHLATEYFKLMAKVDIVHIPYRGTAPAVTDLIAGQITMMITGVPPLIQHVKGGKLRGVAVATAQRLTLLPDLPTIAEAGVPGYEATQWYGILMPAKTPPAIVTRLHDEIAKGLQRPEVRERLAADAAQPVGNKPEEFGEFIKSEIARWAPVVKASGARPD
jgi:tripartite-type tricarboxylate transporter receptor subunit TctC